MGDRAEAGHRLDPISSVGFAALAQSPEAVSRIGRPWNSEADSGHGCRRQRRWTEDSEADQTNQIAPNARPQSSSCIPFRDDCWQLILIAVGGRTHIARRGSIYRRDLIRRRSVSANCENLNSSFFLPVSSCPRKRRLRYMPDLVNRNFPKSAFGTGVVLEVMQLIQLPN